MRPRLLVLCFGLCFLLAHNGTQAQNCRAVSDCSSGRCVATVSCDNGGVSSQPVSPPLSNPSPSAYNPPRTLASLTELSVERLPESVALKTQTPPPANYRRDLSDTQARWCIYESVRLQKLRVAQENSLVREKVAEHRTACGGATIDPSVENMIISEMALARPILERQGSFYLKILSIN